MAPTSTRGADTIDTVADTPWRAVDEVLPVAWVASPLVGAGSGPRQCVVFRGRMRPRWLTQALGHAGAFGFRGRVSPRPGRSRANRTARPGPT